MDTINEVALGKRVEPLHLNVIIFDTYDNKEILLEILSGKIIDAFRMADKEMGFVDEFAKFFKKEKFELPLQRMYCGAVEFTLRITTSPPSVFEDMSGRGRCIRLDLIERTE